MEKPNPRQRRTFTADDKIGFIRKHLLKSKLVDTCDEHRIHPTMMQNWLKVVLEAGREALAGSSKKETKDHQKLIAKYEKELEKKNRIIAELSGEILNLKKDLGEL